MNKRNLVCLIASFFTLVAPSAATGDPENTSHSQVDEGPGPIPIAITISGGSSMGAYEAGFLYFMTETIKQHPGRFELRVVTGASAGSINAVLTVFAMGLPPLFEPTASPYYKTWMSETMTYPQLFDTDDAPAGSLSTGKSVLENALSFQDTWTSGLSVPVDMLVGLSTTRVKGGHTRLAPDVSSVRLEEQLVFRVTSNKGAAPLVRNFSARKRGAPAQAMLPFEKSPEEGMSVAEHQFGLVTEAMLSSSAFPLGFPPHHVPVCIGETGAKVQTVCRRPNVTLELRDGGVVDNAPLHLAYDMARRGVPRSNSRGGTHGLDDMMFLFLDPFNAPYECKDGKKKKKEGYSLFREAAGLVGEYVKYSMSAELASLVTEHPEVMSQLAVTKRNYPDASGPLENFFGFLESDFRMFDFYLGMYDARAFLEKTKSARTEIGTRHHDFKKAVIGVNTLDENRDEEGWRRFRCMEATFEGGDGSVCEGEDLTNFRILLKASLERKKNAELHTEDPHECTGTNDMRLFLDILEKEGFHFQDLGLEADESDLAGQRLRELFADRLHSFSKKLPCVESAVLETVGKPLINMFEYLPPKLMLYATLGKGGELGLSGALGKSRRLRINTALLVEGLFTLGWQDPVAAFTAAIGPEVEIVGNAKRQVRMGLRAGYQFSTQGGLSVDSCDLSRTSLDCSMPVAQAFFALGVYERLRIQAGLEWSPPWFNGVPPENDDVFNILLGVGWQWLPIF